MRMAVVGCEASGKTVFMCALADYYGLDASKNPQRLRLTPENAAANSFERYQYRQMRCLKQWPPATPPGRSVEMKWSLRYNGAVLAGIDMLEFGGETYRAAFRDTEGTAEKDDCAKELLAYLEGTDYFVVLVSIKALLVSEASLSDEDFARETEALWVTRGLIDFIRAKRPDAGVVIGLTQADRYRNELAEAGGPQQLLASRWPSIAAAAQDIPVVEVASVSKTDDLGNPAEGYNTHGILPVMRAFSKHCFGDENALETGDKNLKRKNRKASQRRPIRTAVLCLFAMLAAAFGVWRWAPRPTVQVIRNVPVAHYVTNTVETLVTHVVTNDVTTVVERPVTNTVEKFVEKVIEKVVERPVTNTVEKIVRQIQVVEKVVTNVIEKAVVPKPKPTAPSAAQPTNTPPAAVAKKTAPAQPKTEASTESLNIQYQVPAGYRIWTDDRGRRVPAKWMAVAADGESVTLLTRKGRKIEAVLSKFSPDDQTYIRDAVRQHAVRDEILVDGTWVRNPILRNK